MPTSGSAVVEVGGGRATVSVGGGGGGGMVFLPFPFASFGMKLQTTT